MTKEKFVRVNLGRQTIHTEDLPEKWRELGGRALIARLLREEVPPGTDPLGSENKLIIAPGLLAGTTAPCAGRLSLGAKSPLTGGIKESNVGGTVSRALSSCGVRAIVLEGQAADNLYLLHVTADTLQLEPADDLAGLGNYATAAELRRRYGGRCAVLSCGPAGEKGLPVASVAATDGQGLPARHAGRGGLGAVMGSKGLKAIVVESGKTKNLPARQEEFRNQCRPWAKELARSKTGMTKQGTACLVLPINAVNGVPTYNFRRGNTPFAESLSGDVLERLCQERGGRTGHNCSPGCVIRCSNIFHGPDGQYLTAGLEYETIALLGSNCGIGDLDDVAALDRLCDDYGLDTMEMGVTLGVAMEGGLLSFGDASRAKELLKEVSEGTFTGRVLGQGAAVTGRILGVRRVPTVLNQGMAGYDPRALKGNGATYATSPMGADHTAGNCLPGRGGLDIKSPAGQVDLSRELQIITAVCDSLGLCTFVGPVRETLPQFAALLTAYHGREIDEQAVLEMGKAVLQDEVDFNEAAGLSVCHNDLPRFFREEPLEGTDLVFDIPQRELAAIWD